MHGLARAFCFLTRARDGGAKIEHGLIAALVGVVIVSVVTSLGARMEPAPATASEAVGPR